MMLVDAINTYSTVTDRPASHAFVPSTLTQPGRGLPVELFDCIIGLLESNPYALLACCLTCKHFREHAEGRLTKLFHYTIFLHDITAFNHFAEEIHAIPGRARPIARLSLEKRPLVFSSVPLRLASQLVNLRRLGLRFIREAPNVPSSTWFLYGRAFSRVVYLDLCEVQFSSFMDFVRFITAFRNLKCLDLQQVSHVHSGTVPPIILWPPRKLNPLEHLHLRWMSNDDGHFLGLFAHWLSSRDGVVQHLHIDDTIYSHPSGFLLLESVRSHLQQLTLDTNNLSFVGPRKPWQRFIGE